jgi:hypothetical protein
MIFRFWTVVFVDISKVDAMLYLRCMNRVLKYYLEQLFEENFTKNESDM